VFEIFSKKLKILKRFFFGVPDQKKNMFLTKRNQKIPGYPLVPGGGKVGKDDKQR
jgi:hypothetical protein